MQTPRPHRAAGAAFLTLPLTLALLAVTPAAAHKAHQHGVATLELAVEPQRLSLRLETPLDNLVGFERAPRTDAERAAVDRALARLRDPAALVQVDGAAGCTLQASRIDAPVLGLAAATPAAGTVAMAQAGNKADSKSSEHADLVLEVDFNCRDGARAGFVQLGLFDAFPRLRRVEVQAVSPRGQLGAVLARPNGRITLAR